MRLPDDFLVGASTAAHQVEGGNTTSDWWGYEQARPELLEPSGQACDSFHRWEQDMDLVAGAGLDAYRFSVEWARIEPEDGAIDTAAVDHYRRMVAGARERGIEPVVTLHHFTNPAWFAAGGGWLRADAADRFLRYLDAVAPVIDEGVRTVITINEPNMIAIMHRVISGEVSLKTGLGGEVPLPDPAVRDALIGVHEKARQQLHAHHAGLRVGWSVANQNVQALEGGAERAADISEQIEDVFLRAADGDDLIGVQSYSRMQVGPDGPVEPAPEVERTSIGWEYRPEALGEAIAHTAEQVPGVPILVTENGISTRDDQRRIDYTTGALRGLGRCLAEGIDVRGYLHWSLLDNFEWGRWDPTFGLVAVDRESGAFERTPKPSLAWLGEIARSRTLP